MRQPRFDAKRLLLPTLFNSSIAGSIPKHFCNILPTVLLCGLIGKRCSMIFQEARITFFEIEAPFFKSLNFHLHQVFQKMQFAIF